MTAIELVNKVLDLAEIAQKAGNKVAYRKCMEIIADIALEEAQAHITEEA